MSDIKLLSIRNGDARELAGEAVALEKSLQTLIEHNLEGLLGYHSVSKKHMHRYIAEREFVYNARKLDDGARTVLAIKKSEGKRLRYREPA